MSYAGLIVEKKPKQEIFTAQRAYWNSVPGNPGGPISGKQLVKEIMDLCGPIYSDKIILDYGCGGIARLYEGLKENEVPIKLYVASDIAEVLLKTATERHPEIIGIYLKDNSDVPFIDNYFDVIQIYSIMTHTSSEQDREILTTLRRTLRPNGIMLISFFIGEGNSGDSIMKSSMDIQKMFTELNLSINKIGKITEQGSNFQTLYMVTKPEGKKS